MQVFVNVYQTFDLLGSYESAICNQQYGFQSFACISHDLFAFVHPESKRQLLLLTLDFLWQRQALVQHFLLKNHSTCRNLF